MSMDSLLPRGRRQGPWRVIQRLSVQKNASAAMTPEALSPPVFPLPRRDSGGTHGVGLHELPFHFFERQEVDVVGHVLQETELQFCRLPVFCPRCNGYQRTVVIPILQHATPLMVHLAREHSPLFVLRVPVWIVRIVCLRRP